MEPSYTTSPKHERQIADIHQESEAEMGTQKRPYDDGYNLQPPSNTAILWPYKHGWHDRSTGDNQISKRHQTSCRAFLPNSNYTIMQPTSAPWPPQIPCGVFPSRPSWISHDNGLHSSGQGTDPWTHLQTLNDQMSFNIAESSDQQWPHLEMILQPGTVPPDLTTDESALSNLSGIHTPAGGELDSSWALTNGQDDNFATQDWTWENSLAYDETFQNIDWQILEQHDNCELAPSGSSSKLIAG